jgi:ABC-type glycerol-3-phosphate transport system substrate-binding protein
MKRVRLIVGLTAVTALLAGACSSGDDSGSSSAGGKTELTFWVFEEGGIGSFLSTLEDDFESKYPKVDLKVTSYPEDNYDVKLQTAIAAGKTPDLVLVFGPEQMKAGLLLPLDDVVKDNNIDLTHYVQSIVKPGDEFSCAFEGHLYCIGSYAGSVQMLYNKDLFDAAGIPYPKPWPPMTPEQFVDTACKLTDKDKGVWGGAASDPLAYLPWEMFFSKDGRTATFNSPDVVHQFEVLASGYKDGCIPSSNVLDPWEQGRDYFVKGQLAMVITDFQDLDKLDKSGINWGTTASPTPAGYDPYFFVWTDSVGIMANSDHPDEAKEFLAYLTTTGQTIRYKTSGDIPLDLSIAKHVNWAQGVPGRQQGLDVLAHARTTNFVPNRWDVIGPYYDAWGYVLAGEKSAQDALDDAQSAIQDNLDKAWDDWEGQG